MSDKSKTTRIKNSIKAATLIVLAGLSACIAVVLKMQPIGDIDDQYGGTLIELFPLILAIYLFVIWLPAWSDT